MATARRARTREVIESGLPEARHIPVAFCKREAQLPCWRTVPAFPEIPRDALLQHFQDNGWGAFGGFANEQMHVIGHDHIRVRALLGARRKFDQQEFVAVTNFPKGLNENIARSRRVEQRQPPIATKREEMQMAASVVTLQTFRHDTNPHA